MKKLIALAMALVMAISLAACGGSAPAEKAPAANAPAANTPAASTETVKLKMHFVDPETAPYVQGGLKIAELVKEATALSRSRFLPAVPWAASATPSSWPWITAWTSPPAPTPF